MKIKKTTLEFVIVITLLFTSVSSLFFFDNREFLTKKLYHPKLKQIEKEHLQNLGKNSIYKITPFVSITQDPKDSMTISYESFEPVTGKIKFGEDENLNLIKQDDLISHRHEITLEDLKENTKYYYKIENTNDNKIHYFYTAPNKNQDFTFWHITHTRANDAYLNNQYNERRVKFLTLSNFLLKQQPKLIIHSGDSVNSFFEESNILTQFFEIFREILYNTPIMISPANHEGCNTINCKFKKFFVLPQNGSESGKELWYSFEYGNTLFISLEYAYFGVDEDSEQLSWLIQQLKETKKKNKIIYFGGWNHGKNTFVVDNLVPLINNFDIDLIIGGDGGEFQNRYVENIPYIHNTEDSALKFIVKDQQINIEKYDYTNNLLTDTWSIKLE